MQPIVCLGGRCGTQKEDGRTAGLPGYAGLSHDSRPVDIQLRTSAVVAESVEIPNHLPVRVQHDDDVSDNVDQEPARVTLSSRREDLLDGPDDSRVLATS